MNEPQIQIIATKQTILFNKDGKAHTVSPTTGIQLAPDWIEEAEAWPLAVRSGAVVKVNVQTPPADPELVNRELPKPAETVDAETLRKAAIVSQEGAEAELANRERAEQEAPTLDFAGTKTTRGGRK